MTEADKANEGREEKTEGELLEEALIHIDGLNEQIESLRDQLSKEREFNEKLKQGLENGSERWKKHLELENNTLKEQLAKERKMRKELVDALDTILDEYDKDELIIRVGRFDKLKTLIAKAKATELDKK